MRAIRVTCILVCLLCLTTQSGCKGLKSLVRLAKGFVKSGADDLMKAGKISRAAANGGDDVVFRIGPKAVTEADMVVFALKRLKNVRAAYEWATGNSQKAHAAVSRAGPQLATRAMMFLQIRYQQNVDALESEVAQLSDGMTDSQAAAAQKHIDRIAREQAAIASLAERMQEGAGHE